MLVVLGLFAARRIAYHLSYLTLDAFSLATISDGQLYEEAARDILAAPPLGTEPFYLQGLYAYLLALPIGLAGQVVVGLLLQLVIVAGALVLFHRSATRLFGPVTGSLSTVVLFAYPELAFYENKYLSVALGVSCNILVVWAFVRCIDASVQGEAGSLSSSRSGARQRAIRSRHAHLLLGLASGMAILGRPNMLLALPFTAAALWVLLRARDARVMRALSLFALGCMLACAPMAARNLAVTGRPDVLPSHGGGIPFYIGNNPHANGRWNTAGGLLSGQVYRERSELLRALDLEPAAGETAARAVGDELYRRGLRYIARHPGGWLQLLVEKAWLLIGNHTFVRDYDLNGEKELLGAIHHVGLPFAAVLALGVIGLAAVARRGREHGGERSVWRATSLLLYGQVVAVVAANLLYFTSAQNRVPLAVPLCFVAGPALIALWARLMRKPLASWTVGLPLAALAALLFVQGFASRGPRSEQPSSVHYYNLASVEAALGRDREALDNYRRAAERNPRQPVFWLSYGRASERLGRIAQARRAYDRALSLPDADPAVRAMASRRRRALSAGEDGTRDGQ